jgi:hypothetical protein
VLAVVAGVCCVVDSLIGVSEFVIVLTLIFAWWCKGSSSTLKKAAVILNVSTWSKPLEVRQKTLMKVEALTDSADPVNVWRAHTLLNALYVFETARNVLPYSLCP